MPWNTLRALGVKFVDSYRVEPDRLAPDPTIAAMHTN
jgi:hypothetical protein